MLWKWITSNLAQVVILFGAAFGAVGLVVAALINGKYSTLNKIIESGDKQRELADKREEESKEEWRELKRQMGDMGTDLYHLRNENIETKAQVLHYKEENTELIRLNNALAAEVERVKREQAAEIERVKAERDLLIRAADDRYYMLLEKFEKLQAEHNTLRQQMLKMVDGDAIGLE